MVRKVKKRTKRKQGQMDHIQKVQNLTDAHKKVNLLNPTTCFAWSQVVNCRIQFSVMGNHSY